MKSSPPGEYFLTYYRYLYLWKHPNGYTLRTYEGRPRAFCAGNPLKSLLLFVELIGIEPTTS
ncbi:hypothetical protein ACFL6I_09875 [candidate division KSB1 bacterium]